MARVLDPNDQADGDDPGRYDSSGLYCPHCGSNDFQVKQMPVPGGWYPGQGVCNVCGRPFGIRLVDETATTGESGRKTGT
jgi:hypothetical protein